MSYTVVTRWCIQPLLAFISFCILGNVPTGMLRQPAHAEDNVLNNHEPIIVDKNTPRKRLAHLEKAFLRRCVKLSDDQSIALSKVLIDEDSSLTATDNSAEDSKNALLYRQSTRKFEKALIGILDPLQKDSFLLEKEAREQFICDAKSLGVAIFFDQKLSLSVEQLNALQRDLAKWSGIKNVEIEAYENTSSMIPIIKESILLDNLTRSQLDSLANYRKISIAIDLPQNDDLFSSVLIAH